MKNIRYTKPQPVLEERLAKDNNEPLAKWLELSIKELEYRSRYSKLEETQVLQGALRALYDIQSFT